MTAPLMMGLQMKRDHHQCEEGKAEKERLLPECTLTTDHTILFFDHGRTGDADGSRPGKSFQVVCSRQQ